MCHSPLTSQNLHLCTILVNLSFATATIVLPQAPSLHETLMHTLTNAIAASNSPDALFHPFNVLLILLVTLTLASILKSLHVVPFVYHVRLDRAVAILTCVLISTSVYRVCHASLAGHLSTTRFLQYFLAGGVCAFVTHAACTPIDVVKTRIQTTQGRYDGMVDAFTKIVADEGMPTLLKGLGATAGGYFLHGAFKYSFYEVFKLLLSSSADVAVKPPLPIAALSGFMAECIACMLLCPMEAIRIRSVADSGFPSGVSAGLLLLLKAEGVHGWYKGLPAMLLKQVPYTVGQFVSFEFSVKFVKAVVSAIFPGISIASVAASISCVAGLLAGITAAVISHPGDTILSKVNQEESDGSPFSHIARVARSAGISGLFIGLGPRLLQVSCMIGGQFMIYDSIKLWCGIIPASALPATAFVVQQVASAKGASAIAATDLATDVIEATANSSATLSLKSGLAAVAKKHR